MKTQRSDEVLRGGSEHVNLEPPKRVTRTEAEERWPELAADTWPWSDGLEAVKVALRGDNMTELRDTAPCTYCGRPLSDFARRVHAVGAHAAWSLASKEHTVDCWWIASRAGHTRSAAPNPRRASSVALLRAMDRAPRSYLIEVLRVVHANAERGELDDLLREAFGPSTAAKIRPRAWRDLRDRFAGRLYMGPESERWATDTELRKWLSAESSAESPFESGERIAGVALCAHLMAFVAGET